MTNRWDLPDLGLGLGLRGPHVRQVLDEQPALGFFEVISENLMGTDGPAMRRLLRVAERYPIVLHGVSLSIGSTDPLDDEYLSLLRALAERVGARWVSDHLCWTGVAGRNTHDLLPMPYTEAALAHVVARARRVSETLERPLVLENPSSYVEFRASTMPESEFMARLVEEADCGRLLDVNNVYVSAFNHGFDARAYLDAMPADRIVQIHLAGHTHKGTHILDTHSDHVIDEVWALYEYVLARVGPVSTMVEWDEDIPAFDVVYAEIGKAAPRLECARVRVGGRDAAPDAPGAGRDALPDALANGREGLGDRAAEATRARR